VQRKGVAFNAPVAARDEFICREEADSEASPLIRADADAVGDTLSATLGVGSQNVGAANDAGWDVVELNEAERGARSDARLDDAASRVEEVEGDALRTSLEA